MKIKVSFFFFALLLSLFLTHSYTALALVLAAALHELGHIFAARLFDIPLGELRLGAFGAAITPKYGLTSYKKELALVIAGPLVNLASASVIFAYADTTDSFLSLFGFASLFLGMLNLLPIDDLDGGRFLRCAMLLKYPPDKVTRMCSSISFLLVFSLWILSVYLLLRLSLSLSLFTFSLSLFCKIFLKQKL